MNISKLLYRALHRHRRIMNTRAYSEHQNPVIRTWKLLSKEIPSVFGKKRNDILYPEHADIVIIGGGFIGSSVAYWLKTRAGEGLSVVVIEKDPTFKEAQKNMHVATITQHFSLPENVHLARYSAEFLRNVKENLNNNVNIQYAPTGHLVLASEMYANKLEENVMLMKEYGLKNEFMTVQEINNKYPWLNTENIKLGSMSVESEGTFNSWELLKGLVQKSEELGTIYVNAEVVGFELEQQRDVLMEGISPGSFEKISRVKYRTSDNEEVSIKFAGCILCAGYESKEVAQLAKVGIGDGLLSIPLPIIPREHKLYSVAGKTIGFNIPLLTDTTGLLLSRNGLANNLLCGHTPLAQDSELPESEYFSNIIKPSLIHRIPDLKDAEISQWNKNIYDCTTYDETGILGPHPYHNNLYMAVGFGKLGTFQAPAIGRAIAELIIDSHYTTIDLTRFGFDRILIDQPLVEFNVY